MALPGKCWEMDVDQEVEKSFLKNRIFVICLLGISGSLFCKKKIDNSVKILTSLKYFERVNDMNFLSELYQN